MLQLSYIAPWHEPSVATNRQPIHRPLAVLSAASDFLASIAAAYIHDQRGPWVKSISEIASSNGLFRPVFQDIRNIRVNLGKFWRLSGQNIYFVRLI